MIEKLRKELRRICTNDSTTKIEAICMDCSKNVIVKVMNIPVNKEKTHLAAICPLCNEILWVMVIALNKDQSICFTHYLQKDFLKTYYPNV